MHRFFCPQLDLNAQKISLTDPKEIHHLVDVLRFNKNNQVVIFNNKQEDDGRSHGKKIK